MEKIWTDLYEAAKAVQNDREISDKVWAGGVAAAIESASGKMIDYEQGKVVTLGELTPSWWI